MLNEKCVRIMFQHKSKIITPFGVDRKNGVQKLVSFIFYLIKSIKNTSVAKKYARISFRTQKHLRTNLT